MKKYLITGVMTYAHCYEIEVEANNTKEATKLAEECIEIKKDPAMAEFQEYIMDKPQLLED